MKRLVWWMVLLVTALPAAAHDLYLVLEGEGAERKVCARVGEHFPESMNAVKLERIATFRLTGERGRELKAEVDAAAKQTCAPLPSDVTSASAEMTSHASFIELKAKDFNGYITAERFQRVIELRKQRGESDAPGREMYSRYAKVIAPGDKMPMQVLGHELEIVPKKDPAKVRKGEPLPVQVLFRNKPLAGVQVAAMYAGAKVEGHSFPVTAVTDKNGEAMLKLDRPGLWYARLIHMLPKAEGGEPLTSYIAPNGTKEKAPDYDWRSYFATLTFEIRAK